MLHVILFGAPGSGKSTQSEKIIEKYGLEHISTGKLLRSEIAQDTEIGRIVKTQIDNGELVPNDLIFTLLTNRLNEKSNVNGVIFDGFPRTKTQAKDLENFFKARGSKIDIVINLAVNEKELISRILQRSETSGRSDDKLETVEKRLTTYNNQTKPILEFYKNDGKLVDIQGERSVDEIFEKICEAIDAL